MFTWLGQNFWISQKSFSYKCPSRMGPENILMHSIWKTEMKPPALCRSRVTGTYLNAHLIQSGTAACSANILPYLGSSFSSHAPWSRCVRSALWWRSWRTQDTHEIKARCSKSWHQYELLPMGFSSCLQVQTHSCSHLPGPGLGWGKRGT